MMYQKLTILVPLVLLVSVVLISAQSDEEKLEEYFEKVDEIEEELERLDQVEVVLLEKEEALEKSVDKNTKKLEKAIDELEHLHDKEIAVCSYRKEIYAYDNGTIYYDSILVEEGLNHGMNITSGMFTAPAAGVYEVSAAGVCHNEFLEKAVYLMTGDGNLEDMYFLYGRTGSRREEGFTSCSGFRYVELEEGEDLYLYYTYEPAFTTMEMTTTTSTTIFTTLSTIDLEWNTTVTTTTTATTASFATSSTTTSTTTTPMPNIGIEELKFCVSFYK